MIRNFYSKFLMHKRNKRASFDHKISMQWAAITHLIADLKIYYNAL